LSTSGFSGQSGAVFGSSPKWRARGCPGRQPMRLKGRGLTSHTSFTHLRTSLGCSQSCLDTRPSRGWRWPLSSLLSMRPPIAVGNARLSTPISSPWADLGSGCSLRGALAPEPGITPRLGQSEEHALFDVGDGAARRGRFWPQPGYTNFPTTLLSWDTSPGASLCKRSLWDPGPSAEIRSRGVAQDEAILTRPGERGGMEGTRMFRQTGSSLHSAATEIRETGEGCSASALVLFQVQHRGGDRFLRLRDAARSARRTGTRQRSSSLQLQLWFAEGVFVAVQYVLSCPPRLANLRSSYRQLSLIKVDMFQPWRARLLRQTNVGVILCLNEGFLRAQCILSHRRIGRQTHSQPSLADGIRSWSLRSKSLQARRNCPPRCQIVGSNIISLAS
jgi:hypothetical protein